eukprot:s758_g14.t1
MVGRFEAEAAGNRSAMGSSSASMAQPSEVNWHSAFRRIKWFDQLPSKGIPLLSQPGERPHILVAHLFSGRRRIGDVHWHLQALAASLGLEFTILSLDTAVHSSLGDLHWTSHTWSMLEQCYDAGLVGLTLVGSPCETFSEARHMEPPEGVTGWPRPLRSADWLFGLPGLSMKELAQVHVGTGFWLQGLRTLCSHLCHGGLFLSEHPAVPHDESRASTWTAGITQLLRDHIGVDLRHISQWQWGATAVKPTGLLSLGLPRLIPSMNKQKLPGATRPAQHAIGKNASGEFRTMCLKEYPDQLCLSFATAFADQLRQDLRAGHCHHVDGWTSGDNFFALRQWVLDAAEAGRTIKSEASCLPDYQPRYCTN